MKVLAWILFFQPRALFDMNLGSCHATLQRPQPSKPVTPKTGPVVKNAGRLGFDFFVAGRFWMGGGWRGLGVGSGKGRSAKGVEGEGVWGEGWCKLGMCHPDTKKTPSHKCIQT